MKEVMVHMYIEKQNRFPYLSFAHVFLILWRKAEIIYVWWLLGITKMAGHSFPVSLGLPRWRPCQIPDPGQRLNVKIPTQGEALSVNFLWVARPPTLGLNIDRCIIILKKRLQNNGFRTLQRNHLFSVALCIMRMRTWWLARVFSSYDPEARVFFRNVVN